MLICHPRYKSSEYLVTDKTFTLKKKCWPCLFLAFLCLNAFPEIIYAYDSAANRAVGNAIGWVGILFIFGCGWVIWTVLKWLGSAFTQKNDHIRNSPIRNLPPITKQTQCPKCHAFYTVQPEHIGKMTNCKRCGEMFQISDAPGYISLDEATE